MLVDPLDLGVPEPVTTFAVKSPVCNWKGSRLVRLFTLDVHGFRSILPLENSIASVGRLVSLKSRRDADLINNFERAF